MTSVRKSGIRAGALGALGMVLGVVGILASLVFPAFIGYVFVYAAFHDGKLPP